MTTDIFRAPRATLAAAVLAGLGSFGAAEAATLTYLGDFAMGYYITGRFEGTDLDGDERLSGAELTDFHAIVDNRNGGPGQYYFETTEVSDFLFEIVDGLASLSGTLTYWATGTTCGGWGQPPCMAMRALAFGSGSTGHGTGSYSYPISTSFTADRIDYYTTLTPAPVPAPVPLPAGLPLMGAGLVGLALLRRRKPG